MSGARGNGLARRLEEAGVAAAGLVTVALTHGRRWLLRESRSSGPARRARQATAVTNAAAMNAAVTNAVAGAAAPVTSPRKAPAPAAAPDPARPAGAALAERIPVPVRRDQPAPPRQGRLVEAGEGEGASRPAARARREPRPAGDGRHEG